jgi:hypothetical protein
MHPPPPTGTTGKAPPPLVGPPGFGGGAGVWLDAIVLAVDAPFGDTTPAITPNPTIKTRAIAPPRDAILVLHKRAAWRRTVFLSAFGGSKSS